MAEVILPGTGRTMVFDLDTCVKTGRTTSQRVTLRGRTTPSWVILLLLLSVIGFLLASSMTSRRYEITLPFDHAQYRRWFLGRGVAFIVGLIGAGTLVVGAMSRGQYAGAMALAGLVIVLGAVVWGTFNGWVNGVAVRVNREHDLVLVGVHPHFVEAVRTASTEPLAPR